MSDAVHAMISGDPNRAVPPCPAWCDEHIGSLHQHHVGAATGQLQVVLERQDDDGIPGRLQLSFRFCADGELIDDSAEFPVDAILDILGTRRK